MGAKRKQEFLLLYFIITSHAILLNCADEIHNCTYVASYVALFTPHTILGNKYVERQFICTFYPFHFIYITHKRYILIGWVQFDVKSELEIELSGITFAYKWVWTFWLCTCVWHIHYNARNQLLHMFYPPDSVISYLYWKMFHRSSLHESPPKCN